MVRGLRSGYQMGKDLEAAQAQSTAILSKKIPGARGITANQRNAALGVVDDERKRQMQERLASAEIAAGRFSPSTAQTPKPAATLSDAAKMQQGNALFGHAPNPDLARNLFGETGLPDGAAVAAVSPLTSARKPIYKSKGRYSDVETPGSSLYQPERDSTPLSWS